MLAPHWVSTTDGPPWVNIESCGAPGGIRTHDPQIRNLVLYPAELRAQSMPNVTHHSTKTNRSMALLETSYVKLATRQLLSGNE